ncbi:acetyl-CoA carboxylase biotin carboxyl carrier protein subunit [Enterococcus phoeniculicola]|jgi:biotin carboxyl carrier protein|uniref:Acetyl-CoA carboxylase biotin carboxyl carrier protein subunit n=1 Tax=Enterococcus phoeniculicola ATCC BAA-412 TaxID=1158610 RepID=R3TJ33_9ENTE|nr:acetyl-CoA carboxylase biotin carboxyl carrier protein subunit [Enterococcus phoeniculicola]EOL41409.1 acetyl-CoA carboxylase biotin carboxyl carrier protein subunit [Enterococcus phoeniculicola ATCC BAA-412]EOT78654.1 acetyl-CoA carboxylase biotin carboxyl carrier protein subunit [Enterococcus phoeniculicola ATCC BAA-412]OJG70587.1 acetyl-CoA carboxylase biotin carboxyl carrier protein subunit [Enterococcus phoeniculicola]
MLRKFKISIDGKEYLVEMEEIGGVPQPAASIPPAAPAPTQETTPAPVEITPAPVETTQAGADAMPSPMPGTILKILVNVGDSVQENQPLMILEAMKMENEIVAGKAGTISGIHVTQGDMVNPGDSLITIQ